MHEDSNIIFHPVLVFDFADVFPVMAIAARYGEYLAEEPGLDI